MDKSSSFKSFLTGQNLVNAGIAWAVLALLFYLLFSSSVPGEERPLWYSIGTYFFEQVPFITAGVLCFRNWRSPQIASGRNVWLGIGLGMLSFFIGNLLFGWWELYWGLDPAVSPGDLFFLAFYLFLGWGMILAVLPRRLNLETWQWITVVAIAAGSIALALWLFLSSPVDSQESNGIVSTPATQQVSPAPLPKPLTSPKKAPTVKQTPRQASPTKAALPTPVKPAAQKSPEDSTHKKQPPAWVSSLEKVLDPLATPFNFFYIVCDVFLLILATLLLLAFWGGRFAQSWRMIAAATFSFYIADMWFTYATDHIRDYQSGFLLEVFWVFSGVLFAIGTSLEYELSSRSRRAGGRKRA